MKVNLTGYLVVSTILFSAMYLLLTPTADAPLPTPVYSSETLEKKITTSHTAGFTDVTLASGIWQPHRQSSEQLSGLHESLGAGACAFDYNRDGWVDLLTLNGSGKTHFFGKPQWWQSKRSSLSLYHNNGDGTFSDITETSQLVTTAWTMGCASADLDNDGDIDIFISNYGQNQLWRNNGNGTFSNITNNANIHGEYWSTSINMIDINRDGLVDMYVNNYIDFITNSLTFEHASGYEDILPKNFNPALYSGQKNQLFINQGNLVFKEVATELGIDNPQGRSLSSYWADLNSDTFPDLMVLNDVDSPNKLYINRQGKAFDDLSTDSQLSFIDRSSSAASNDFNGDQQQDIFISTGRSHYPKLQTQQNHNRLLFIDIAKPLKLNESVGTSKQQWGSISEDFNLDGWPDVFITNGSSTQNQDAPLIPKGQPNTLLVNEAGEKLADYSHKIAPKTYHSYASRCATNLDFNNDGAPDIYVTHNNGLGQLLKNDSKNHRWIGLQLTAKNNESITGTRIYLQTKKRIKEYHLQKESFLCSGDKRVIFGLSKETDTEKPSIKILWPNGDHQTLTNLDENYYYAINQGGSPKKIIYKKPPLSSAIRFSEPSKKLAVIQWLVDNKAFKLANKELEKLLEYKDSNIRLNALALSLSLPSKYQSNFTQRAFLDSSDSIVLAAIDRVKNSEDERLSRWLIKALSANNDDVFCAGADAFGVFFEEEEAMIISKYTALNSLIKRTDSGTNIQKICAIEALGHSEHYRALPALIELLSNAEQQIQLAAIRALGLLKEKKANPALEQLFLSSQEPAESRAEALISIKKIDNQYNIDNLLTQSLKIEKDIYKLTETLDFLLHQSKESLIVRKPIENFLNSNDLTDSIKYSSNKRQDYSEKNIKSTAEKSPQILKNEKEKTLHNIETFLIGNNSFEKGLPQLIEKGVNSSDNDIRIKTLILLTKRKERWARNIISDTLASDNTPESIKISIIENLPNQVPTGLMRLLTTIYHNNPNTVLSAYIAKQLIKRGNTAIIDDTFIRLREAIEHSNENIAFLWADALILQKPKAVLDTIIIQE